MITIKIGHIPLEDADPYTKFFRSLTLEFYIAVAIGITVFILAVSYESVEPYASFFFPVFIIYMMVRWSIRPNHIDTGSLAYLSIDETQIIIEDEQRRVVKTYLQSDVDRITMPRPFKGSMMQIPTTAGWVYDPMTDPELARVALWTRHLLVLETSNGVTFYPLAFDSHYNINRFCRELRKWNTQPLAYIS